MNDISCSYTGDRETALIAYLYDDINPAERAAFDAHLGSCARCRHDLDALGGVRAQLAHWSPPEPRMAIGRQWTAADAAPVASRRSMWREIPVWAQVAAAMLFLGASAAIANLDVRYDQNGLVVRTGWTQAPANVTTAATVVNPAGPAPWRADLATLERQLRTEFRAPQLPPVPMDVRAGRSTSSDAELVRRVKAMIDESERRQERELALRIAAVMQDMNVQRQADLRKIDQSLGVIQDRTGVEAFKNREMVNYLLQRVSQRQ